MSISNRVLIAAIGLSAFTAMSGCSAASNHGSTEIAGTSDRPLAWDASVAESFSSLAEVSRGAKLVVEATAGESRVEEVSGVPFTVTSVRISRLYKGSSQDNQVDVRQFGDIHNSDLTFSELLRTRERYLLFLEPFEFAKGVPTDQWVIVGGVAAWRGEDAGGFRGTAPSSRLPERLTPAEVESVVGSDPSEAPQG